jgi:hypothetical protein
VQPSVEDISEWYNKAEIAQQQAVREGFFSSAIAAELDQYLQEYRQQSLVQK